jgi:NAD(P)-dependent dehydrogenase (short-subunit alcohol dehydrogenase family)
MILITGASRGIGKFLLTHYHQAGIPVLGTWNNTAPDYELAEHYFQVDVTDPLSVSHWLEAAGDRLQQLVLINCAGSNYNAFAHKSDLQEWQNVLNINLIGTFTVIRALLPIMREQGYGRIINFSSIVAQSGIPGTSAYAASKAGLWGMTKSIAAENASRGITINNLNLGYFDIGMITEVPDAFREVIRSRIPYGNFGDPINILNAVEFLIHSDYINGSAIDINGALH